MHVNNFSKENTQLVKDNALLGQKAQRLDHLEQRCTDLQNSLTKEKELNQALTKAQEGDDADGSESVFKT